ncbi:site-specific recombinase XerD [Rhodococcus opacus]|nr:site-specific recombinase XerD [Rhodococcus opacus]
MMDAAGSGAQQNDPIALRNRLIVELLYATGIRVGELCGLDLGSVDREQWLLRVIGKGDKERSVPYGKPAADAVDLWLHVGRPAVATDSDTAADPWGSNPGTVPPPSRAGIR